MGMSLKLKVAHHWMFLAQITQVWVICTLGKLEREVKASNTVGINNICIANNNYL